MPCFRGPVPDFPLSPPATGGRESMLRPAAPLYPSSIGSGSIRRATSGQPASKRALDQVRGRARARRRTARTAGWCVTWSRIVARLPGKLGGPFIVPEVPPQRALPGAANSQDHDVGIRRLENNSIDSSTAGFEQRLANGAAHRMGFRRLGKFLRRRGNLLGACRKAKYQEIAPCTDRCTSLLKMSSTSDRARSTILRVRLMG